jgi:hypothetical protein
VPFKTRLHHIANTVAWKLVTAWRCAYLLHRGAFSEQRKRANGGLVMTVALGAG